MKEGKGTFTSDSILRVSSRRRMEAIEGSNAISMILQEIKEWWSSSSGEFNSLEMNSLPFVEQFFGKSSTANTWSPDQATMARHMDVFRKSLSFSPAEDPGLNKLLLNLENFYIQSFTKGISAYGVAFQAYKRMDTFISRFQVIERSFSNLFPGISLHAIALDRYPGCLCGLEMGEDKLVTLSSFRFYKAAVDVFRLSGNMAPIILEIGSGWGGEALYRLMTDHQQKNILIDLREMCLLQYYNLKSRFPGLRICLIIQDISKSDFEEKLDSCDILIMSDTSYLNLKECLFGKVNVIRNSDSFVEMTSGQFSTYLCDFPELLARGGSLFHTNDTSAIDLDDCIYEFGRLVLKESWQECLYEQSKSSVYKSSVWRKS